MFRSSQSKSDSIIGAQSDGSLAIAAIEALYQREMKANLAALREQKRRKRLEKSMQNWIEYWPVAVGVAIACVAPQLSDLLALVHPWGMWLIFPFVVMAKRPEMNLVDGMGSMLPLVMLYAQFPLEGLVARRALRGNVTLSGVAWQVLFFHFLGATELWLVNGALLQMFR